MFSFVQDLRYALRMLLKSPAFTTVAVLTLALGIGANVATFSVVYAVLLRPLPFPHPEQLVRVFDDLRGPSEQDVGMSAPELWDLQDRSGVFQEISAVAPSNSAVAGGERTVRAESLVTSPDYFALLGAQPQLGRVYSPEDAAPGFLDPVVISDGFWRRYYGSDPKIIGRKMRLDSDIYTIAGVMPPGFRHPGPTLNTDVEVWAAAGFNAAPFPVPADRSLRMLPGAIGRLKPGLSVAQAQAQLDSYISQLTRQYPVDYPAASRWAIRLIPVKEDLVGPQRTELFILFGAVGFVLLIACVNIANLLLARSSGRRREIAIRLTLGASHARLARQLLTESTLLSLLSGMVAIVTVLFLKNAILSLAPADIPRLNEVDISAGVLFFAFLISIFTGVLFGLAPALQAANPDQIENLREGGRGSGTGRRHTRLSRVLVVSEVALSIVLLAGAGLLLRSFWRVLEVRPGFNPSHLATVQIWIPISNNPANDPYSVEEKRADFLLEVYRRVSALPGLEQASISGNDTLPMNSGRNYSVFSIQGRATESERNPVADIAVVDAQYFHTMEVPLITGRNFTVLDTYKTQPVAVIDQTLARQYWPNENPLGQQLKFAFGRGTQGLTIIGVAGDIKSDGFEAPSVPHIYVPLGQFAPVNAVVFLRSRGDTGNLGEAVRHEVESIDPNVPVHSISSMDQIIARSVANRRFALELLGVFAVVALLLAAIGIYGVMSYSFSQRAHEVGIRIALGAQRLDILRMALGEGMRTVVIGLASGLVTAAIMTRFFRSMLFNVAPADPITYLSVSAVLAAVALFACYIPARRATRVDPLTALREE
ncbi:MAG TPA: ABC transporter permease [Bryobacteraceae bacterium]|nr:ABC transporter permease [Bryobacteraceae bacterium]